MKVPDEGEPSVHCGDWQLQYFSAPRRWELTIKPGVDALGFRSDTYRKCAAVFYDKEFCTSVWSWLVYHAT